MRRYQKLLILFMSFSFTIIWMSEYIIRIKDEESEAFNESTLKIEKLTTKYLLLWTRSDYAPFDFLGEGNEAFIRNKCPFLNCFVTSRRDFFGEDLTKFDAIAFNGRNIMSLRPSDLPKTRSPHQKYIFFNMESSDNDPICNPLFDGFFNWTATYKLNSDIVYGYLVIRNAAGEEVGPRIDMTWEEFDDDVFVSMNRSKAAVWMASNCHTRSKREGYVKSLRTALKSYGHTIDIYGKCGRLKCPKTLDSCDSIPSKYYFYLSFENSKAEDYVTEKVYTAVKNGVVPIVYGGANYSRFLPPGSYIDAMKYNPKKLASIMAALVKNSSTYSSFFKWRNHYTYHKSEEVEDVCRVCTALNDKAMLEERKVYNDLRAWWNPDHVRRCTVGEYTNKNWLSARRTRKRRVPYHGTRLT